MTTSLQRVLQAWQPPRFEPLAPSVIADRPDSRVRESPDFINAAREALDVAFETSNFANLARRHLAYGIIAADEETVTRRPDGLADLLNEAVRRSDGSSARTVLRAVLDSFDPKSSRTGLLTNALKALHDRLPHRQGEFVRDLALDEPQEAISRVGGILKRGGDDLAALRVRHPLVLPTPLGAHAAAAIIESDADDPVLDPRTVTSSVASADGSDNPGLRPLLYPALIRPFLEKDPPPERKKAIQSLVLDTYGDPRLSVTAKPRLAGDPDGKLARDCVDVVRRWLAVETFRLFIEVIDRTGVDEWWEDRRDFWLRYFEAGRVSDVRAIFAGDAADVARRIKRDDGETGLTWAKLGQARRDHSVLLMQIGDLRIAEWSHSGKVRFWLPDTRPQPSMQARDYIGPELRNGSIPVWHPHRNGFVEGFSHHQNGYWRGFTAATIQKHTGVRV